MSSPKGLKVAKALKRIQVRAPSPRMEMESGSYKGLQIAWPSGLAPKPRPLSPKPKPSASLPKVDIVAMMDTEAEAEAMCDVLTPGYYYKTDWYQYAKDFKAYKPLLGPNTAATGSDSYLGLYMPITIGKLKVLVYKTNLHLKVDGKKLKNGQYTTPITKMLAQIIGDAKPKVFLTTGTSGGVYCSMQLGDVGVTRAAHFDCQDEFKNAPFNGKTYKSDWEVPKTYAAEAHKLMSGFAGELTSKGEPSEPCNCNPSTKYPTNIYFDGVAPIPAFHPVITTDSFLFGTSSNGLDKLGLDVETDDACLGLVCSQMKNPPLWASVRNLSDPCINGKLSSSDQSNCADFYYDKYGYWTTVMSGITTWSIIAGYK
jgi:hypothetical protein